MHENDIMRLKHSEKVAQNRGILHEKRKEKAMADRTGSDSSSDCYNLCRMLETFTEDGIFTDN